MSKYINIAGSTSADCSYVWKDSVQSGVCIVFPTFNRMEQNIEFLVQIDRMHRIYGMQYIQFTWSKVGTAGATDAAQLSYRLLPELRDCKQCVLQQLLSCAVLCVEADFKCGIYKFTTITQRAHRAEQSIGETNFQCVKIAEPHTHTSCLLD